MSRAPSPRERSYGRLTPALLVTGATLLVLAAVACGVASQASTGTPAASRTPKPGASAAASASPGPLKIKVVGHDSVLLHARRPVGFTFSFPGGAPDRWM